MAKNNPIVLNFQESLIRLSDLELLTGPYWLNDTIISFYFEYLETYKFKNNPILLFVPPQVTQCIKITPVHEIGVFMEPLDSKIRDFIFFALNDNEQTEVSGGTHWSLLVFSYPDRKCFHFDSSSGVNHTQAVELGKKVLSYLKIGGAEKIIEAPCLQQTNGYDCGIHLLAQCEHLANYVNISGCLSGVPFLARDVIDSKRNQILDVINYLGKSREPFIL